MPRSGWLAEGLKIAFEIGKDLIKMTIKRRVFYSFHFEQDYWRTSQVRQIGALEGNEPASDNDWEDIKKGGEASIKRWINSQLKGRSCVVVLIGTHTANRKWINYEIKRAWELDKGVVGVYIHNLKDENQKQSAKGKNPFAYVRVQGRLLSSIAKAYDPPSSISTNVYAHIKSNISDWIEEAIEIRNSQ